MRGFDEAQAASFQQRILQAVTDQRIVLRAGEIQGVNPQAYKTSFVFLQTLLSDLYALNADVIWAHTRDEKSREVMKEAP